MLAGRVGFDVPFVRGEWWKGVDMDAELGERDVDVDVDVDLIAFLLLPRIIW